MSNAMRRKIAMNEAMAERAKNRRAEQEIAAENLIVIGGKKIDLSKDYAASMKPGESADSFSTRFVTANGKVYDLDAGESEPLETTLRNTYTIDGRVLHIGDYGEGLSFVVELYEQFLKACHHQMKAVYRKFDREWSSDIIEQCKSKHAKRLLEAKTDPATLDAYWVIDWGNPHVTFEDWMEWSAATLRWRIKVDLPRRYEHELDIRTRDTLTSARDALEPALIAVEKFLAMPEQSIRGGSKLTAV